MLNVVLLIICCPTSYGFKNYSEYTLFRTVPSTEEQLEFVKKLSENISMDFWLAPGVVNKPIDVLINPNDKKLFMRTMDEKRYDYTSVIHDVQRAFDLQTIKPYVRRKMETFSWNNYFKIDDIYSWMKDLEQSYPNELTIMKLGETYENREILGMKIIFRGSKRRSAVIIEGGIHAREWISPAVVTYFLDQLVKNHNKPDTPLGKIALTYEFYVVPVLNPDGYEYSMKTDRMWRKNRNGGYGIDINRNFNAGFGSTGVSFNKKDETYCGTHAFSEKESQAMEKLASSLSNKLEYYLGFHSYGQYMIIPYAHSRNHLDNYDEMHSILDKARNKLSEKFGTKYTVGTAYDTVGYTTSGVSMCWAKKALRVPYAATFELRDSGRTGFALPATQIVPTSVETLDAITSILTPKEIKFNKLNSHYNFDTGNAVKGNYDKVDILVNILFFVLIRYDF